MNLGEGVKSSKFNFFRTWSCCISNKKESQMQQPSGKYFVSRPPNTGGLNVKIQLFQNITMLSISPMQQNGSKYFASRPPLTQPLGSIVQNSTFSEHGHAAYQIKKESQMQQHGRKYFRSRPPPRQHWGSKCQNLCHEVQYI